MPPTNYRVCGNRRHHPSHEIGRAAEERGNRPSHDMARLTPGVTRASGPAVLLLLFGLIVNGPALAEGADSESLHAEDLVFRVLSENGGLAAMRSTVDAARARVEPAGALPDAQLSGAVAPETIGGYDSPTGRGANIRIELSQEIPWPGTLDLRADAARKEASAATDDVAALRLRLAAATRATFSEWHYVHQALLINADNQDLVQELRRIAETRYAAGLTGQQDVLQAEIELQHLKHQAVKLRSLKRRVRAKINGLLNRPATDPLGVPAALPTPGSLPAYPRLQRRALASHPELAQIQKRIAASGDRKALARKDFYPDFRLFGGYNGLWDADEKRWIAGVSISLPLDRGKYRARLDETRAETIRMEYELGDRRAALLSQLEQAHAAVAETAHTIALYQQELLPLARENLSAARSEYGAGGGAFLNVITAERRKLEAELELASTRAEHFAALAELQRWTGGELPAVTTGIRAETPQVQYEQR